MVKDNFFQLFKTLCGSANRLPFKSFIIVTLGCYPSLKSFMTLYKSMAHPHIADGRKASSYGG